MRDKCKIIMTNGFSIISRITLLLVILNLNIALLYGTESIWVRPFDIKFNYETGQTYDALTIRKADGTAITNPEWASANNEDENENFAYVISQPSRKVKVRFDSNCENMHLVIKLTVTSGTGIGGICNLFVCNYHQLDEVTLTLNGTPGTVGKRTFTWQWEIYGIPINNANFCAAWETTETTHTYYTLLATPQAPMAEPWSSVLDYACSWASGQSTEPTIISSLTTNLHNSGVKYGGGTYHTIGSKTNLNLTYLLNDLDAAPTNTYMDCRDFANFLHVLSNALGLDGCYYLIYHNNSNCLDVIVQFYYNYLWPAGQSPTRGYWNYHQVGWYNNSSVADASTLIDSDSIPSASPYSWKLPVGDMTISEYFNKLSGNPLKSCGSGTCTVY